MREGRCAGGASSKLTGDLRPTWSPSRGTASRCGIMRSLSVGKGPMLGEIGHWAFLAAATLYVMVLMLLVWFGR